MTKTFYSIIIFLSFILSLQGKEIFDSSLVQHSVHLVTGKFMEAETDIEIPGPQNLKFQRVFLLEPRKFNPLAIGWQFNVPDLGKAEIPRTKFLPPPGYLYRYEYDTSKRLSRVELVNQKDLSVISWLNIAYYDGVCSVTGSNAHTAHYFLTKDPKGGVQLKSVEKGNGYRCDYEYMPHPFERELLITERRERNGISSRFTYFGKEDKDKVGKVHQFYQSCDGGKTYSQVCTFDYEPGVTSVTDAQQVLTKYYYDESGAVAKIETYIPNASGHELYKTQQFVWKEGHLKRKTILDNLGNVSLRQRWKYNAKGDLIRESLEGVLTKDKTGLERFNKRYEYDSNHLLIEEQEDEGPIMRYRYSEDQSQLLAQYIYDGTKIIHRMFYTYDSQGQVLCTMIDDGSGLDSSDMTDVRERVFERVLQRDPAGMPLEEVKGIVNISTLEELIAETIVNSYDLKGNMIRQTIRHPFKEEESWKEHSYDEKGTLLETKTSQNGTTLFSKFEKRIFHADKEFVYIYSNKGELISEETFQNGRKIDGMHYSYYQNEVHRSDFGGNVSTSVSDCLGRVVEEISPTVLISESICDKGHTRFSYDIFDRIVSHTDPLGNTEKTVFNVRGKPLFHLFPDGSFEERQYTLSGRLQKELFRNGTYNTYSYDSLGRVLLKSHYGSNHQMLKWSRYTYDRSLLVQEEHSNGITITHQYDMSGRKVESLAQPTGRRITYEYTEEGYLLSQKEWNSEGEFIEKTEQVSPNLSEDLPTIDWVENGRGQCVLQKTFHRGCQTIVCVHDALKRLEKKEIYSATGQVCCITHFRHDLNGNKIKEWVEIPCEDTYKTIVCSAWEYDACGHPVKITAGFGFPEETSETHLYNPYGQLELTTTQDGTNLYYAYDAAGMLSQLSSSDQTVDYSLQVDSEGQVTEVWDNVHQLKHARVYNLEGQLIEELLPSGLKSQNRFDRFGRRIELVMPDLSKVKYHYLEDYLASISRENDLGEEKYSYKYLERDAQGRTLKASLIGNLGEVIFQRTEKGRPVSTSSPYFSEKMALDEYGRIIELITQGEKTTFSYDSHSQIQLEEGASSHRYSFDPVHNLQSKDGKVFSSNPLNQLFSEEELEYDLKGNLIKKRSGNSTLLFAYDALNRLIKVEKEGQVIHDYIYDLFHRRVIDMANSFHRFFMYDGNWEMGCCDENRNIQEFRVFEPSVDLDHGSCIAFELQGNIFAPLYNLTGSVAALVSFTTKEIIEAYRYSAFGECESDSSLNPWLFANKRYDPQTGLTHFGRRDYDASLCRFITQDPIGFSDGLNRYAYLHNNPLNARDLFGLKSLSEHWSGFVEKLKFLVSNFFGSLRNLISTTFDYIIHHIIGAGVLLLLGHYKPGPKTGIYGQGEVNGKVRVTFINGILTDHSAILDSVKALSESHGNVNIHYLFRYTKGGAADFLSSFLVQIGFVSPDAHQLASEWRKLIADMGGVGGGGKIIHYAHSIGCMETLRALSLMTPDEKAMIEVYAFGSPSFAVKDTRSQVHHFASLRDGVCLLDLSSFIKACMGKMKNVTLVGTLIGFPFIDHLFASQTYQDLWKSMGRTFTDWYGSLDAA